ncbi:AtpZ/AtpI family protein [Thermodesulfobacteriota bacterium]
MPEQKKKLFDYKKNRVWAENLQIVMQIGLTMVGCIFFCFFFVGRPLDQWLGTKGVFTAVFIVLGVIGGAVVVYRQILEVTEPREKSKRNSDNGST